MIVDDFDEAAQRTLSGFCCGPEPWARAATEWLKGSDSIESMERRATKVWLYYNDSDELVGFGSLGPTRRRWPPPNGEFENLLIIPMLGIDQRFRGQPPDVAKRFASQIMADLIGNARQYSRNRVLEGRSAVELLLLYVHKDNLRAQQLYRRFDFVQASGGVDPLVLMMHRLPPEWELFAS